MRRWRRTRPGNALVGASAGQGLVFHRVHVFLAALFFLPTAAAEAEETKDAISFAKVAVITIGVVLVLTVCCGAVAKAFRKAPEAAAPTPQAAAPQDGPSHCRHHHSLHHTRDSCDPEGLWCWTRDGGAPSSRAGSRAFFSDMFRHMRKRD
eukprot:s2013_g19.t1